MSEIPEQINQEQDLDSYWILDTNSNDLREYGPNENNWITHNLIDFGFNILLE